MLCTYPQCLVDLVKSVPTVRNTFGTLSTLHNFIKASSKRCAVFKKVQEESNTEYEKVEKVQEYLIKVNKKTLKSLSDTRWNCRIETIRSVFKIIFEIESTDTHSGSNMASL